MKKLTIVNRLTPYLLLACVLLAGVLALQHRTAEPPPRPAPTAAVADVEPPPRKNFNPPGLAAFRDVVQRPLFFADRQLPPEPKPPPPKPRVPVKVTPFSLQLEGVVLASNEKFAVFVDPTSKEVLHLTIGDIYQGWELTSITDLTTTFERGAQVQQLTMEE